MEAMAIVRDIESLPPEDQKQVMNFIAFLKSQHPVRQPMRRPPKGKLIDEPFIGMWRKRKDMQDSASWAPNLRQREWKPNE
ncbi:MAG: DUF2281 domain-containing protein [Candidatus Omnitrophota bacterium]